MTAVSTANSKILAAVDEKKYKYTNKAKRLF